MGNYTRTNLWKKRCFVAPTPVACILSVLGFIKKQSSKKNLYLILIEVKVLVAQLCLTLCNPMDLACHGLLSVGILQARILEWVAIPFSGASS